MNIEQFEKLFTKDILPIGALPVYDLPNDGVVVHKGSRQVVFEKLFGDRLQLTMTFKPRYVEFIAALKLLQENTDKTKIVSKNKHMYWDGTIISNDAEVLSVLKLLGKNVIYDQNIDGILQLPAPQFLGVLCADNAEKYGFFCYPTNVVNIKSAQDLISTLS